MNKEKQESPEIEHLKNEIKKLHDRLSIVELSLQNFRSSASPTNELVTSSAETEFEIKLPFQGKGSFESGVGEYGMAWIGNIVLLFGLTFLVQYLQNKGYAVFSFLTGFISIAAIYATAHFTRNSYAYLSRLLSYNGHILLFYFSIHLHFFENNPIIGNDTIGIILTLLVPVVLFFIAFRRKSQLLMFIVLLMFLIAGVIANSISILSVICSLTALLAAFLVFRFGWQQLYFSFIFIVYIAHWIWLLNNPFLGNSFEFISSPGFNFISVFITGLAFSLLPFFPRKEKISDDFIIASIIFNGLGFTSILLVSTFTFYISNYVLLHSIIAVFCLFYSILLKKRNGHEIIASMYALYGFLAMSVAFFGLYGLPASFFMFAFQSLLVVSMALWFRSRFIVIMNTILYFLLLTFYLKNNADATSTNFAFMLVAFITARIINWKKERLNIKTEWVRNFYLVAGFVMTLITFYNAFPADYVTVSWIVVAILFFTLSIIIKNVKYRWIAIATVIASAIKLIFMDMSNIDIGYRVLVFLGMAIISIIVSILYTRYFKKKKD